jgi:sugar diacid utilization regulator
MTNDKNYVQVTTQLVQAQTLQEIIDAARELIGNPLMLTDLTHKLLAISNETQINDPAWNEIMSLGGIPLDRIQSERTAAIYNVSMRESRPVLDEVSPNLTLVRTSIVCNAKLTGYLDVICYNHPVTPEDYDIIKLTASLLSFRMEKDLNYGNSPENVLDFFVADLLEGRITDEALISERFRYFDWECTFPISIVAIKGNQHWENLSLTHRKFHLKQAADWMSQEFPQAKVLIYGSQLRMLLPILPNPREAEPQVHKLIDFLAKHKWTAGISRPLFYLDEISSFHLQAVKALELGEMMHDDRVLFSYDNYAIFHMLEYASELKDIMTFCHTAIFILAEYDMKHETDLLETLRVYLDCHCNIAEAATSLFIHRNTMNYRISKIYDLTGVDLNNTQTFFHLMFSYHVLEYYSITVKKDYDLQLKRKPILKMHKKDYNVPLEEEE